MSANNEPTLLTCPTCNAPLDFDGIHTLIRCKFCGNSSVFPSSILSGESTAHPAWDEICQLVNDGNLEKAADRFQTTFKTDAEDSKEAVKAIENGRLVAHSSPEKHSARELFEVMKRIQRLAGSGRKNEAAELYRNNFDLSADQIENALNLIANSSSSFTQEDVEPLAYVPAQKRTTGVFVVIPIVIVFVIGLLALIIFSATSNQYISMQSEILVNSPDGMTQSIGSTFHDSNADNYFVGLVDISSRKLIWKSEPIKEIDRYLANDSSQIYATNGADLMAYAIADGSLVWQTEMSDALGYGDLPILAASGRVITMTADQKITSYDAASGSQVWSRDLLINDSTLRLMGDSLVIRDYFPGTYDTSLFLVDPLTGEQQEVLNPVCIINDYENKMDSDTGIVYDQKENSLFLFLDSGCVQRYDLNSKNQVWNTTDENTFNNLYTGFTPLVTESDLYFGNAGDLVKVNKATGDETILVSNPNYKLIPLTQIGENLILRAKRTKGTARFELWGVDAESGVVNWQKNMGDAEPIDPPDEMAGLIDDTDYGWTWHMTDAGLVLLTFSGEPNQLVIDTLNPADGTSLGSKTIALKNVSGTFYGIPHVIAWQGSVGYFDIDTDLYSLDLDAGKITKIY